MCEGAVLWRAPRKLPSSHILCLQDLAITSALHPDLKGDFDIVLELALSSASVYRITALQQGGNGLSGMMTECSWAA